MSRHRPDFDRGKHRRADLPPFPAQCIQIQARVLAFFPARPVNGARAVRARFNGRHAPFLAMPCPRLPVGDDE